MRSIHRARIALVPLAFALGQLTLAYDPNSVADAWANHAAAFGSEDLDKIMLDYTEHSVVELYDAATDTNTVYEGTAKIREMFSGLFKTLGMPNPFTVPVDPIIEEPTTTTKFGQVFLLWEAADKGFPRVTDTFIFSQTTFKILRQNIVTFPPGGCPKPTTSMDELRITNPSSPVQKAWDNHFAAFGGQNLTKIMLDYTDESKAMFFDNVANLPIAVNVGMTAIEGMFTALFQDLGNRSDLAAPLVHTSTFGLDGSSSGEELGQTFLIWRSPIDGYAYVTDTFVYNSEGVILRQNIVAMKKPSCASYNPQNVAEAWANHAAAFGSEDLDKIMLDYTQHSVVELYDAATDTNTVYEGTAKIRDMFFGLFKTLGMPNPFTVPVDPIIEEPTTTMKFGQVFLLWEAAGKGFPRVTDTFIYGSMSFKILRQNIVTFPAEGCPTMSTTNDVAKAAATSPIQKGWENHFSAFGAQNLTNIMLDYTDESKAMFFDNVANLPIAVNVGMTAIEGMFTALFQDLAKRTDLAAPLIHTSTFGLDGSSSGEELGQTFLVWRSPIDGYAYVTDTFVYDSVGKIIRQNIVAMKKDPCSDVQLSKSVKTSVPAALAMAAALGTACAVEC